VFSSPTSQISTEGGAGEIHQIVKEDKHKDNTSPFPQNLEGFQVVRPALQPFAVFP